MAAVFSCVLLSATAASAGTFGLDGSGNLVYTDDASASKSISVTYVSSNGGEIRITEPSSAGSPGSGCRESGSYLYCPTSSSKVLTLSMSDGNDEVTLTNVASVASLTADLGSGDDTLEESGSNYSLPATVTGGSGDDEVNLYKNQAALTISGEDGDDILVAGEGNADDVLDGGADDDVLYGVRRLTGDDTTGHESTSSCSGCTTSNGADLFVGGDGTDTVTYLNRTDVAANAATLSADDQANDGAGNGQEEDNIGSDVEDIVGGRGDDTFYNNNALQNGNYFDGGDSSTDEDTVSYAGVTSADSITTPIVFSIDDSGHQDLANDGADTNGDDIADEGDSDYRVENLIGGKGNDKLEGKASDANDIYGGEGDDTIAPKGGSGTIEDVAYGEDGDDTFVASGTSSDGEDDFIGGDDTDEVSYASRTAAVTVNLSDTSRNDGQSNEDYVHQDIENVTGGSGDDTITTQDDMTVNVLTGGAGSDDFKFTSSGVDGADVVIGGDGTTDNGSHDEVFYASRSNKVTINLSDTTANDGQDGEGDYIHQDVEDATTGSGNDVLTGSSSANSFNAGNGTDSLTGNSGDDTLDGGSSSDTFYVNSTLDGNDTFSDTGSSSSGSDTVDYSARPSSLPVTVDIDGDDDDGSSAEADNVTTSIENVTGSAGSDTLTGSSSNNALTGNAGDDVITGELGNDTLSGGADNDQFIATSESTDGLSDDGNDTINGGTETDTADYTVRKSDLFITLEDTDDDGQIGEGDNVGSNVEVVKTGDGNDEITGSDHSTEINTGNGDDTVTGGNSQETIYAGSGDDTIDSRDGLGIVDTDDCGPGQDSATVDGPASNPTDIVIDCEQVQGDAEPEPTPPATTQETTPAQPAEQAVVTTQSVSSSEQVVTESNNSTVIASTNPTDTNAPIVTPSKPTCVKPASKSKKAKTKYKKCVKNKVKMVQSASSWSYITGKGTDASYSSGFKSIEGSIIVQKGKKCLVLKNGKLVKAKSCAAAKKTRVWSKAKITGSVSSKGGTVTFKLRVPGLKKGMKIVSSLFRGTDNAGNVGKPKPISSAKFKYKSFK